MKLRKKYIIISSVAAFSLLIIIVTVLLLKNTALEQELDKAQSAQSSIQKDASAKRPSALSADNAQFLETALNSPDKAERAKAVVPELRGNSWLANANLPKGSTITIDRDSFSTDKNGKGSMDGSISGLIPITFTLYLQQIDGKWLIESAEQT